MESGSGYSPLLFSCLFFGGVFQSYEAPFVDAFQSGPIVEKERKLAILKTIRYINPCQTKRNSKCGRRNWLCKITRTSSARKFGRVSGTKFPVSRPNRSVNARKYFKSLNGVVQAIHSRIIEMPLQGACSLAIMNKSLLLVAAKALTFHP
jgi:hypothetical protein